MHSRHTYTTYPMLLDYTAIWTPDPSCPFRRVWSPGPRPCGRRKVAWEQGYSYALQELPVRLWYVLVITAVWKRCRDGALPLCWPLLLCYHPYLVCILFGMPSLHLFYIFNVFYFFYIYIYSTYVQCMRTHAVCGQYDLTTRVHLHSWKPFSSEFRVVLLFVVNIDTPNTSRRALKPSEDKEDRLRRRRERDSESWTCGRDSRAKAGKINEAGGERELSPVDDVHTKIFKQCWWCVRGRWEGGQQCSVITSWWCCLGAYTFVGCKLHCCILTLLTHPS